LHELQFLGFDYEVWRISPDNGEVQVIAGSGGSSGNAVEYVEKRIHLLNAEWYIRIFSVRAWYQFPEIWAFAAISLILSFLLATVAQRNLELRVLKNKLEHLSNTDPLTGIYNRRYFLKTVSEQMNRVSRVGSESYIIVLDMDYFKDVNDKYGHPFGDVVLQEATASISLALRSYDVFARYGGEEFIIFVTDVDRESVSALAERIRLSVSETLIDVKDTSISMTASLGIAPAAPANELSEAIAFADIALYKAKQEGRNRACFYEEILDESTAVDV
jgi:diguanylate cyclase (GGDEF)-like protein